MQVKINEPCSEDWNKMRIGLRSRHCAACEKSVMDFTQMNRVEIITYIMENSDKKICGRMNYKQFDFQHEDVPLIVDTLSKKGGNSSFLVLSLLCLSLAACSETPQKKPGKDKEKIELTGERTMGEVAIEPTNKKSTSDEASAKPVKKVIIPEVFPPDPYPGLLPEPYPEPYYLGEPIIEPVPELKQKVEDEILTYAEVMPEFPGGMEAMKKYLAENIKYPQMEMENGIEGKVYLRFVVDEAGKLSDVKVLRGVNGGPGCDKEARRVVQAMPNWKPGMNNGKACKVYMTIPVVFRLN
jgi:TonB family protein